MSTHFNAAWNKMSPQEQSEYIKSCQELEEKDALVERAEDIVYISKKLQKEAYDLHNEKFKALMKAKERDEKEFEL